jgi:hypothetical protein
MARTVHVYSDHVSAVNVALFEWLRYSTDHCKPNIQLQSEHQWEMTTRPKPRMNTMSKTPIISCHFSLPTSCTIPIPFPICVTRFCLDAKLPQSPYILHYVLFMSRACEFRNRWEKYKRCCCLLRSVQNSWIHWRRWTHSDSPTWTWPSSTLG